MGTLSLSMLSELRFGQTWLTLSGLKKGGRFFLFLFLFFKLGESKFSLAPFCTTTGPCIVNIQIQHGLRESSESYCSRGVG